MNQVLNPLRYPGGKRTLVNYIDDLLRANNLQGVTFIEPYAGSAVVGLELLRRGTIGYLVLCEKDILIYAFWKSVFDRTDDLCERIMETPVTIETWHNLSYLRQVEDLTGASLLDLGFAGLFFNRTNFSGILNAGPIGGLSQNSKYSIDCRFNKTRLVNIIRRLSELRDQVEVHCGDAITFMKSQQKSFLKRSTFAYFDPPYYRKGSRMYRHFYTEKDHMELAKYVTQVRYLDWIISYDDAPFIYHLYASLGAQCRSFHLDYSCAPRVRPTGHELLISNLPLPPFPYSRVAEL